MFLFASTVVGGSLETSGGGVIKVENGGLNAVVIAADLLVEVVDGTAVTLSNSNVTHATIVNHGTIDVGVSTGGNLIAASAGATLWGGGQVVMIGASSSISGSAFVNANNTIEGSGSITGLTSFDNQANGLVEANQAHTLDISNTSNEGLLEAANGAELELNADTTTTQNAHGGNGEISGRRSGL